MWIIEYVGVFDTWSQNLVWPCPVTAGHRLHHSTVIYFLLSRPVSPSLTQVATVAVGRKEGWQGTRALLEKALGRLQHRKQLQWVRIYSVTMLRTQCGTVDRCIAVRTKATIWPQVRTQPAWRCFVPPHPCPASALEKH